jgi:hypothetical protein
MLYTKRNLVILISAIVLLMLNVAITFGLFELGVPVVVTSLILVVLDIAAAKFLSFKLNGRA